MKQMSEIVKFKKQDEESSEVRVYKKKKKMMKLFMKQSDQFRMRNFSIILRIPKSLPNKNYFRTNYNIQLSLDTYDDNPLGDLSTNIFTVGYLVTKTEFKSDKLVFSLQARDDTVVSIEVIYRILDSLYMPKAKHNLEQFVLSHKDFSNITWATDEDLSELEAYAANHPFESYVFRYVENGNRILEYVNNLKYIYLMGITREMLQNYYAESNILPCAIKVVQYLDVWNKVFEAVALGQQRFEIELQNYNGQRTHVQVEQRKLFWQNASDGHVYCKLYWIYHSEPNEELALRNQQNILEAQNPRPKVCTYKIRSREEWK